MDCKLEECRQMLPEECRHDNTLYGMDTCCIYQVFFVKLERKFLGSFIPCRFFVLGIADPILLVVKNDLEQYFSDS
jgi:hypothetical protein